MNTLPLVGVSGCAGGSSSSRPMKRNRRGCRAPTHFQSTSPAEERFVKHAIENSKLDRSLPIHRKLCIPPAPVFYPTIADFEDNPLNYVEKIRPIAEKYGICKIVPPVGWNPGIEFGVDLNSTERFQTKQQLLHRIQEGISFGDGVEYTPSEYLKVASERSSAWKRNHYPYHDRPIADDVTSSPEATGSMDDQGSTTSNHNHNNHSHYQRFTPDNIESDYWDIVEKTKEVIVEYGNDVDTQIFGSGFPLSERGRAMNGTKKLEKMDQPEPKFHTKDYYKETWWNLNNIPFAPGSILRHVRVGITGINVPWMYYGSLFTTFCWHNEDNNLYSINYHHRGAPKVWYGVPGTKECADGLEKVFKSYLSMKMKEVPDLLHHITTMFSPMLLQNAKVPVSKIIQYEGEFVITFPRSYHSGFSLGPNIGEAVNFATSDWIAYGSDANERYRSLARASVFSHDRLTFTMANHLKEQKSYAACKLLLDELERVVNEEIRLRNILLSDGLRDISNLVSLPKNRLDQLDEASAAYDDKRLCHACKHICFFSAVACECSHSKVSCLRHSHFMCRCLPKRKYLMIWSTQEELTQTLSCVRNHCAKLQEFENNATESLTCQDSVVSKLVSHHAVPGTEEDRELHKNYEIPTSTITMQSLKSPTHTAQRMTEKSSKGSQIVIQQESNASITLVGKRKSDDSIC